MTPLTLSNLPYFVFLDPFSKKLSSKERMKVIAVATLIFCLTFGMAHLATNICCKRFIKKKFGSFKKTAVAKQTLGKIASAPLHNGEKQVFLTTKPTRDLKGKEKWAEGDEVEDTAGKLEIVVSSDLDEVFSQCMGRLSKDPDSILKHSTSRPNPFADYFRGLTLLNEKWKKNLDLNADTLP
ncbi:hypothetical protein PHSC3_001061 [Chlamydiales bacterium STE3]|nr:hypothetical protein PHSC3_001061 [Chlamydiales bacterium STE3]